MRTRRSNGSAAAGIRRKEQTRGRSTLQIARGDVARCFALVSALCCSNSRLHSRSRTRRASVLSGHTVAVSACFNAISHSDFQLLACGQGGA
jgi:hypothetical protein